MKKTLYILVNLFLVLNVFGQEMISGVSYNMGLTTGETRDFVQNYSWHGFGIEIRSFREGNFSVGGSFSWNVFDEKTGEVIQLQDRTGAVSGTQIRHFNSFPLMLNGHYYFSDASSSFKPYVGLNVGTYYITQRLEIGIFATEENTWHFGMAPEFGLMSPTYRGYIFFVNARYNYAFKAGKTVGGNEGTDWQYWGFNVGIAFSYKDW